MGDEKKTIVLMNKGKRPWTLTDAFGVKKTIDSLEKIELDEAKALQLLLDYPRDFIKASEAGASTKDIARMEQSLRDRSKNLDDREAALDARSASLDEREKALEAREKAMEGTSDENPKPETAKPRGRPAKSAADKGE